MQRHRAVNLNSKCFFFIFPCSLYVSVSACVSFAIRRSFACGEGALAATAAAAAAVRCSFSLIISAFECRHGLLVVLLVLCDACSVAAILLVIARVVGMHLLHNCGSCRDHRAF